MNGIPVVVSEHLPLYPDHRENARRTVRHGRLARQVLAKDGETVGPAPGEPTHHAITIDPPNGTPTLIVSRDTWRHMQEQT